MRQARQTTNTSHCTRQNIFGNGVSDGSCQKHDTCRRGSSRGQGKGFYSFASMTKPHPRYLEASELHEAEVKQERSYIKLSRTLCKVLSLLYLTMLEGRCPFWSKTNLWLVQLTQAVTYKIEYTPSYTDLNISETES